MKNIKQETKDPWVLEVQQWLNKTYGNHPNYGSVVENGKTGWDTIFGIIRAIQLELKVTDNPVDNFGPGTESAWNSQVTPYLKDGYSKGNIVALIDAGFRCKGMGSGKFSNTYTGDNISALQELKAAAGFTGANATFGSDWAKALFDMSAFVLVPGGDATIRKMQQDLNKNYYEYTGILPCDGIYQRQTNTALIFALQAEIGMDPGTANGNYGPGTEAGTPTLNVGDTGNFVKILQYGLYVNGFNQQGDFSGQFTQNVGNEIENFRKFMILPPYVSTSDLTVMKGLLTSNGNTNRSADAFDTSTILTNETARALKGKGYSIVGRYLTGTVGVGEDERDKSLSYAEIDAITSAGLSIFPIYQDGGWYEDYFTAKQGIEDAQLAIDAAYNLGFPVGTTIYFACDVDIQDGNIGGTVIPYFQSIAAAFNFDQSYNVGIYGTRNVCQRAIDLGLANKAFVSNMSSGFSGNLGFAMPQEWAFDQFVEIDEVGVGIDKVAVSGKDTGVDSFVLTREELAKQELLKIYKNFGINNVGFEWEKTVRTEPALNYVVYLTPHMEWEISGEKYGISVLVKDKKVDLKPYFEEISDSILEYASYLKGESKDLETLLNELGPKVENGAIAVGVSARDGLLGTKILLTFEKKIKSGDYEMSSKFQLEVEIYNKPFLESPLPNPVYNDIVEQIENGSFEVDWKLVGGITITAVAGFVLFLFGGEVIALAAAVIVAITEAVTTVAGALAALGTTLMGIYAQFFI